VRVVIRATARFVDGVRADLRRPHRFAAERVGFISVHAASTSTQLLLIAAGYHPVADEDYIDDPSVGARMGQEAIRKALNIALLQPVGLFHVHIHEHRGVPAFSRTDLVGQSHFVPDFFKVRREYPHGALVLSEDSASGRVWLDASTIREIAEFNIVGWRYTFFDTLRSRLSRTPS